MEDLYEKDQVWYGEYAGEKLASLTRKQLLRILSIITRCPKKVMAMHCKAMERRKSEIEACLQAHEEGDEKFSFTLEKGAYYYCERLAQELGWDYDEMSNHVLIRLYREKNGIVKVREGFHVRFDYQKVLAQLDKRPEIVQLRKGFYFDLRECWGEE